MGNTSKKERNVPIKLLNNNKPTNISCGYCNSVVRKMDIIRILECNKILCKHLSCYHYNCLLINQYRCKLCDEEKYKPNNDFKIIKSMSAPTLPFYNPFDEKKNNIQIDDIQIDDIKKSDIQIEQIIDITDNKNTETNDRDK